MPLEDLMLALRARPFVPFRLQLTNGESLEVLHPELCMPGSRSAIIGIPLPSQTEPIYETYSVVDILRIVRLERMQQAAPSGGNGTP